MSPLLRIITRSIIRNNVFIITYYGPGQLGDGPGSDRLSRDGLGCCGLGPQYLMTASMSHSQPHQTRGQSYLHRGSSAPCQTLRGPFGAPNAMITESQ